MNDLPNEKYEQLLNEIPGLSALTKAYCKYTSPQDQLFHMEFALHGLAEYSVISKKYFNTGLAFKDLLSSMLNAPKSGESDEGYLTNLG